MATFVAVTIVMSIRVVGIVLLISLLTIPAVVANLMSQSFGRMLPVYGRLSPYSALSPDSISVTGPTYLRAQSQYLC